MRPCTIVHALWPVVGLVEVNNSPVPPPETAAQNVVEGQAMPEIAPPLPLRESTAQAEEPPVGRVDTARLPELSPATHNDSEAHSTVLKLLSAPSPATRCQAVAPPVGSVELRTLPLLSTATQKPTVGHETPVIGREASTWVIFHDGVAVPGSVEMTRSPALSVATHRLVAAHEMAVMTCEPSMSLTAQADGPPVGSLETRALPLASTATQSDLLGQETPSSGCVSLTFTRDQAVAAELVVGVPALAGTLVLEAGGEVVAAEEADDVLAAPAPAPAPPPPQAPKPNAVNATDAATNGVATRRRAVFAVPGDRVAGLIFGALYSFVLPRASVAALLGG